MAKFTRVTGEAMGDQQCVFRCELSPPLRSGIGSFCCRWTLCHPSCICAHRHTCNVQNSYTQIQSQPSFSKQTVAKELKELNKMSSYVSCPLCAKSYHRQLIERHARACVGVVHTASTSSSASSTAPPALPPKNIVNTSSTSSAASSTPPPPPKSNPWGSLKPWVEDIGFKRKRGLDRPIPEYRHLVVLDFEWTCDNQTPILPHSEIIEFSCVLVATSPRPARITAEFQQYVLPKHNPILSGFATTLTGITQTQIDNGVPLEEAIHRFHTWLTQHGIELPPYSGNANEYKKRMPFAICTWSDADLGSTLPTQMKSLQLDRTPWFDQWINLKLAYTSVYKKSNSGLQKCVEKIGLKFMGRAHSGLVDSINTAAIAIDMINQQNYQFKRCTRYLLQDEWRMVGTKSADKERKRTKVSTVLERK